MTTTQPSRHIDSDPKGNTMKPSDLEEVRHAMNRLRAKASEGVTMQTSTVMNETAIVMDAVYRADREALTAAPASAPGSVDAALQIARSFALDAIAKNIQWALDPRYIIRLCDEIERLRAAPASAAEPVNVKPLGDVLDDLRSKVRQELVDAAHTFRSDAVRSSTMFTAETLVSNVIGREIERYREKALTIDT